MKKLFRRQCIEMQHFFNASVKYISKVYDHPTIFQRETLFVTSCMCLFALLEEEALTKLENTLKGKNLWLKTEILL